MKLNSLLESLRKSLSVCALLIVLAGISFILIGRGTRTVLAQQDPFLNNRINQIEQRFNLIESRLNRIEQESRLSTTIAPQTSLNRDNEINSMHTQIDALQLRVAELECNQIKLDERTLTTAARQARIKTHPNETDRCRLNPNTPLELSARP